MPDAQCRPDQRWSNDPCPRRAGPARAGSWALGAGHQKTGHSTFPSRHRRALSGRHRQAPGLRMPGRRKSRKSTCLGQSPGVNLYPPASACAGFSEQEVGGNERNDSGPDWLRGCADRVRAENPRGSQSRRVAGQKRGHSPFPSRHRSVSSDRRGHAPGQRMAGRRKSRKSPFPGHPACLRLRPPARSFPSRSGPPARGENATY